LFERACECAPGIPAADDSTGSAFVALSDGELRAGFKRAQLLLRLEAKLYYGERR
jgi:hypothetical protein